MKWLITVHCLTYLVIKAAKGNQCLDDCLQQVILDRCACIHKNANISSLCGKSSERLNYTILSQDVGRIAIQLPDLINCGSGRYEINLYVCTNITDGTKCQSWHRHSMIEYTIYEKHECSSCQHKIIPTAIFQYVFTGRYYLEFITIEKIVHKYYPIFIDIDYKAEYINERNVIKVKNKFTEAMQQIEIVINLASILKPPSIYSLLEEKNCKGNCPKLEAKTQVSYLSNGPKYTAQFTDCSTYNNTSWNCTYRTDFFNHTTYVCNLKGLNPGKYLIKYKLTDVYIWCNLDLEGTKYNFRKDTREFSVTNVLSIKPSYDVPKHDMKIIYITSSVVVIVFIMIMAILFSCYYYKQSNTQPRSKMNYRKYKSSDEHLDLPLHQEILIIYTRDSESFMTMIKGFKSLLSSIGNTVVLDIYTNDQTLWEQPQDWLRNKILSVNTKVILFLNNCSATVYHNRNAFVYGDPQWQDLKFADAVMQLKITKCRDYTNFFVTHLQNVTEDIAIFGVLNPATRYLMPIHIDRLLNDIFEDQPNINKLLLNNFKALCQACMEFEEHNPDYIREVFNM